MNKMERMMEFLCFKWYRDSGYAANAETITSIMDETNDKNMPITKDRKIPASVSISVKFSNVNSSGHSIASVGFISNEAKSIHKSGIKNMIPMTERTK